MGKTRVCGARCHLAISKHCRCWCGGLFHGADAAVHRAHFCQAFDVDAPPSTEQRFRELTGQPSLFADGLTAGDDWRGRHDAAKERGRK